MYVAFCLAVGAGYIDGVNFWDPATWSGVLAAPVVLIRAAAALAAFSLCVLNGASSSPAAYRGLAPPVARRTWLLSRVGLLVGIVTVAALAVQLAAEFVARTVGFEDRLSGVPGGLVQTAGLVVAAGLVGAVVTMLVQRQRSMIPLLLLLGLIAPLALFAFAIAFRMPTEVLHALFLQGVLSGQPAPGANLGLVGWIVLSAAVLWFGTGRRAME